MKFLNLLVVSTALLLQAAPLESYNILLMMPFCTKSHRIVFDPIVLALANKGHKVTIMTSVTTIPDSPNIRNVIFQSAVTVMESFRSHYFSGTAPNGIQFMRQLITWFQDMTTAVYQEPEIIEILNNPRDSNGHSKYDLLLIDGTMNEFALPLAQKMEIPAMYLIPLGLYPAIAYNLNIPQPYSYVASIGFPHAREMGLLDRIGNTIEGLMYTLLRNYYILPKIDNIIADFYPEAKPLLELERNISFVLANSHFSLSGVIPTMPYFVEVGGLSLVPSKSLPKDLEDFMQSSEEHGVIYFSFGTIVTGESMPWQMRDKFIKAFRQIPQKVLWKYEQGIEYLPKNVKLIKWAPQQDLLGHPKLRLFITHGGGMSTQEAAYHACPVIAFPLGVDQFGNTRNAVKGGFGETLDWQTFTSEDLVQTIKKIIDDRRYKENALKISTLLQDRSKNPIETSVYWIEYIIRHNGAAHLKSGGGNLNFFQYYLLDIIQLFIFSLLVVAILIFWILKKCLSFCGFTICPSTLYAKLFKLSSTQNGAKQSGKRKAKISTTSQRKKTS